MSHLFSKYDHVTDSAACTVMLMKAAAVETKTSEECNTQTTRSGGPSSLRGETNNGVEKRCPKA